MDRSYIETTAKAAHEINRQYCLILKDDSQVPWDEAPEWQKQSAINGVKFHLENPGAQPEDSHDSWLAEKERDGWKYGPVKDAEKKEHPCFVPYHQLPAEQRTKDLLFTVVVRAAIDEYARLNEARLAWLRKGIPEGESEAER